MGRYVKLDFSCRGKLAGHFIDVATYPKAPGRYRYVPFRGPGHRLLQDDCRYSGFARCTYHKPNGEVGFNVRTVGEYGIVAVDEIDERR
jgi:hypothetical protein